MGPIQTVAGVTNVVVLVTVSWALGVDTEEQKVRIELGALARGTHSRRVKRCYQRRKKPGGSSGLEPRALEFRTQKGSVLSYSQEPGESPIGLDKRQAISDFDGFWSVGEMRKREKRVGGGTLSRGPFTGVLLQGGLRNGMVAGGAWGVFLVVPSVRAMIACL